MAGLTWLASQGPSALLFVRGADERSVLVGLGADPAGSVPPGTTEPGAPAVSILRSADWVVAVDDRIFPRVTQPDVLQRVSVGAEAVALYRDIGKGNHELAHAVDGHIISAVTTSVPPHWRGTDPDRLRLWAEELALADGSDSGLLGFDVLLALAEGAFGLTLAEADVQHPLLIVPDAPATAPAAGQGHGTGVAIADPELVRSHVRHLLDRGVTAEVIAAQAGLTTRGVDSLLNGLTKVIPASRAEQILAIEVPPPGTR
jgi:hypothetical protein